MSQIEKYSHSEQGYCPLLIREGWQVAIANYSESFDVTSLNKIDVHFQTDEAFVLLEGDCVLTSGFENENVMKFECEKLAPGIVYNIPKNMWHNLAMKPGGSVLIIEKDLTHESDFDFYHFSELEFNDFCKCVNAAFDMPKK